MAAFSSGARPRYQSWLNSSDLLAATDARVWTAIKTQWVAFLSATGSHSSIVLAPNRKVVSFSPSSASESPQAASQRFKVDRRVRFCLQHAIWLEFDRCQSLVERWPVSLRTLINQDGDSCEPGPLEGWAARVDLTKRRRGDSVLAGLICFLVYCHEEESFEEMGLFPSEAILEAIFDLREAVAFHGHQVSPNQNRAPGLVEGAINVLVRDLVGDAQATCRSNPLLWWIGILVQSSLSSGPDDFLSRGRFPQNVLTMDMDLEERLAAILHYSKVFMLDEAMVTWQPPRAHLREIEHSMAAVNLEWLNAATNQRPAASTDRRRCDSAAWKDLEGHVAKQQKAFLGREPPTVVGQVRILLAEGVY